MQSSVTHIGKEPGVFYPAPTWLDHEQGAETGVPGRGIVLAVLLSVPLWFGIFALGRKVLALLG